jgi:hypothetical protein
MAWDINRWNRNNLDDFLPEWAAREFGAANASKVAGIMRGYYQLNFQRRPEHLQWWMPKETPRASALSDAELSARGVAAIELAASLTAPGLNVRDDQRDAFFELVGYPVMSMAEANNRFLFGEAGFVEKAKQANERLQLLTEEFNTRIAGGKWRGLMALEPADDDWKSMRIARWEPPKYSRPAPPTPGAGGVIALEAERFTHKTDRPGAAWERIPGLGRTGEGSIAIFPTTAASIAPDKLANDAPRLDYAVNFAAAGEFAVTVYLVPAHPIAGSALRFALALDDTPPEIVTLEFKDGAAEWAQGVVDNTRVATAKLRVPSAGAHTLHVFMVDAGVVLDKLVIDCGGLTPSYLGPPDPRAAAK